MGGDGAEADVMDECLAGWCLVRGFVWERMGLTWTEFWLVVDGWPLHTILVFWEDGEETGRSCVRDDQ